MFPQLGNNPCHVKDPVVDCPKWGTDNDYQVPLSPEVSSMPRPMNDDLYIRWKLVIPATLAGKIEYMLTDPVHQKPIYGSRTKLISALLENWIAQQQGKVGDMLPPVPSLTELRAMGEH